MTPFHPNAAVRGGAPRVTVLSRTRVHALVAAPHPREEELRHAGISFDRVRDRVVDGQAPDVEATIPGALDGRRGRRHEGRRGRRSARTGWGGCCRLLRVGRELVEAEAVDQEVRHLAALRLARHVWSSFWSMMVSSSPVNAPACEPRRGCRGSRAACARCRADQRELAHPPMRPASCFCSGRIVLFRRPTGPLVFIDGALLPLQDADAFARDGCCDHRLDRRRRSRCCPQSLAARSRDARDQVSIRHTRS